MHQPVRLKSVDHALAWLDRCGATSLATDSRRVSPGDAFIAWPGYAVDGREFVPDAFAAGAVACLIEADAEESDDEAVTEQAALDGFELDRDARIASLVDLKEATGHIASLFEQEPSTQLSVVAVTGTNGKTSTSWWVAQALSMLGRRTGVIGTLGVGEPPSPATPQGRVEPTGLTTPDPVILQTALSYFVSAGFSACAVEASSIGIAEHRLSGTHIDVAVFTNFTRDHLDYHGSMTAYWEAKARLFDWPDLRVAVINIDDEQGDALARQWASRGVDRGRELWTYSNEGVYTAAKPEARLRARGVGYLDGGLCFEVVEAAGDGHARAHAHGEGSGDDEAEEVCEVRSRLIGEYNVSNLLAVFATLRSLGVTLQEAASVMPHLTPVPGRMERVAVADTASTTMQGVDADAAANRDDAEPVEPAVIVDYAHTPDALEKALTALRTLTEQREGKLVCIFGCGGNRDAAKRPLMGAIAQRLADRVVLTSDNPRNESPANILAQIASGFEPGHKAPSVIEDRAAAIAATIFQARPRDVILLAGKGHEPDQEVAGVKTPFSDIGHARAALERRADGPAMFTLDEARRMLPGALLVGEGSTPIDRVNTDSRTLNSGDLFVALKGDKFDAHDFLPQARAAGAAAAIAERGLAAAGLPGLEVLDTRKALGELAARWRARFTLPLIAVTGSNGKTTVTQMIASILRAWHGKSAFSTEGNFNNDIGVPLTLLRLRGVMPGAGLATTPGHRAAVVELGMNHPGEIAELARMAAPTVALVNNAQREHQEFMGSVEAVARENGSVIQALRSDGVAVFPADDDHAPVWLALAGNRRVMTFALQGDADVTGTAQWTGGRCWLSLRTPVGDVTAQLRVAGWHNVKNALAAATCALAAGCPLPDIARGLEAFEPVKGRSQLKSYVHGSRTVTLVDDTYNANPDSVRAAVDVLASLPDPGWLILGDMGEVGDAGPEFHREVGAYAATRGVTWLWTVGNLCMHAAEAFNETLMRGSLTGTFNQSRGVRHFAGMADLLEAVRSPGDVPDAATVVVKGSRFMKMEQVVEALQAGAGMLLSLAQWLQTLSPEFGFFRVFQYLTFRAVMAASTALLIGLAFGPWVIKRLAALKIGQPIREYAMQSHMAKNGTPTMGGVLILIGIVVSTLLWFDLSNRFVWIVMLVTLGFGAIGWVDDWRKVVLKDPEGMRSREKFFWQSLIGLVAALYLAFSVSETSNMRVLELFLRWVQSGFSNELPPKADLMLPFSKTVSYPLGVFGFIILTWLVIVGSSNAVNLTDGLDGLAIMPIVMVGSALGVFAYVVGSSVYSRYLLFPYIPGAGELLVFCSAMAGAGLAFLWFNAHPAQVFMGDVGALSLGGALGTIAVITRQEIVLSIMGGIFVVEALSVMCQVSWFKYTKKRYGTGRRLLKMAPLHHHFEKSGWAETQVVVRFWIITMALCLVGLSSLKLR